MIKNQEELDRAIAKGATLFTKWHFNPITCKMSRANNNYSASDVRAFFGSCSLPEGIHPVYFVAYAEVSDDKE